MKPGDVDLREVQKGAGGSLKVIVHTFTSDPTKTIQLGNEND